MNNLRPNDIINDRNYKGHRPAQLVAMLAHYGFEETNNNKHHKFHHRDYSDLTIIMPIGGYVVDVAYVKMAVAACMEVKRRNALRKEPVFGEIPDWAFKALPGGTRIKKEDNRVEFESGAVVDLDTAEMPPVRHYMLEMRAGTLSIRSTDYPLEAFSASFHVKEGSATIGGLKAMFDGLDAQVLAHTKEVAARFNDDIKRLVDNHGFTIEVEQRDNNAPRWVMKHPVYDIDFSVRAPKTGQAISDKSLAKLDALLETSRDEALAQMECLEQWQGRGWTVTEHPANGAAPHYTLSNRAGKSFEIPVYGGNKTFNVAAARAQIKVFEKQESIEPTINSPRVALPLEGNGRIKHPPVRGIAGGTDSD